MSTLITPHRPARPPDDDDDQTAVRAMLSGLPEPGPMPTDLVERISASLIAEQAQRAAISSSPSVVPLVARGDRHRGRFLFAIAGAAAAVVMIGVVGNSLLPDNQLTAARDSATAGLTPGSREASGATPPGTDDKAAVGGYAAPSSVQIRESSTRYTRSDFAAQARALSGSTFAGQPMASTSGGGARIGTAEGVTSCLSGLGVSGAQVVRADLALYEGRPAVIIVATTNGIRTAYAVGRECSPTDSALMHPATLVP